MFSCSRLAIITAQDWPRSREDAISAVLCLVVRGPGRWRRRDTRLSGPGTGCQRIRRSGHLSHVTKTGTTRALYTPWFQSPQRRQPAAGVKPVMAPAKAHTQSPAATPARSCVTEPAQTPGRQSDVHHLS